jgi:ribonuclease-3
MAPIEINFAHGRIGQYQFQQRELLCQALTHKSFQQSHGGERVSHYERLEFLGDSVLGLLISDYLWHRFPTKSEGELSRQRAQLVNERVLSGVCRSIRLNQAIVFGYGEREAGGAEKDSILADVFEAVVGALYVDGGMSAASAFVLPLFEPLIDGGVAGRSNSDFKTELQELTQSLNAGLPEYRLIRESGPPHDRQFEVEVRVASRTLGQGLGSSKKRAEKAAAEQAYRHLADQQLVTNASPPSDQVMARSLYE